MAASPHDEVACEVRGPGAARAPPWSSVPAPTTRHLCILHTYLQKLQPPQILEVLHAQLIAVLVHLRGMWTASSVTMCAPFVPSSSTEQQAAKLGVHSSCHARQGQQHTNQPYQSTFSKDSSMAKSQAGPRREDLRLHTFSMRSITLRALSRASSSSGPCKFQSLGGLLAAEG